MGEFRGRRVSVIGAARSGLAAAETLVRLGAEVLLSDSQTAENLGTARLAEMEATGAAFVVGADIAAALPNGTELVVTSPGVPRDSDLLQTAVRRGIPVWSEIELAFRLTDAPIIATTGTNGKTTTTLLMAAMLEAAGQQPVLCGNISADAIKRTMVEAATSGGSPLVAEISSFQLEWVEKFAPKAAVLTNITPDHLNRYRDFADYAQTKARLFAAQTAEDWAILNYDNAAARQIGEPPLPGRKLWFSATDAAPTGGPAAWVQNGVLTVRMEREFALLPAAELPFTLPGRHSIENVLAAAAASLAMGAEPDAIANAVRQFPGVPHRMEFVAEIGGVRYLNNSMCTNVAAAVNSLHALDRPAIVIAGGAEKGLDFAPLTEALKAKAKQLILIGAAADNMERIFRTGGYDTITRAETLPDAVSQARNFAVPGDVIILSPACASFDMFRDFEERGQIFRDSVRTIREENAP